MTPMQTVDAATARATVRRPVAAPVVAGGILLAGCVTLAVVDPTHGPPVCPFKAVTGWDCPGCGGTRALHQLFTGHLGAALSYNVLAVVILPVLLWGLFASLTGALGGPRWKSISVARPWIWIAFAVVIGFWVVRNLPVAPFDWLGTGT
jgi:hypothetical protein